MRRTGTYRLVGRQLGSNRRLAQTSPEAALLYVLTYPCTDSAGRFSGDPEDIIDEMVPAHARVRGWDIPRIEEMAGELHRRALWHWYTAGDPPVQVVEVLRFHAHQHPSRLAREAPSRWPAPPTPHPSQGAGGDHRSEGNRTVPNGTVLYRPVPDGTQEPLNQSKANQSVVVVKQGTGGGASSSQSDEESRIRGSYARALEAEGIIPTGFKPRELKAAREAAELGTCASWQGEALVDAFRATIRGLRSKKFQVSLASAVNHIGEEWRDNGAGRPAPGTPVLPTGADLIEQMAKEAGVSVEELRRTGGAA